MKVSIKTICPLLLFIFIAYKYEFELIDKAYKDGFLLMLVIVLLIFIVGLKHRKLEKIKKTNNILSNIVENIQDSVVEGIYDQNLMIRYANDAFFKNIGWTKAEFAERFNNEFLQLVPQEEQKEFLQQIEEKLTFDCTIELEYNLLRKDGKIIHILDQSIFIKDESGKITFYSTLTDVSNNQSAINSLVSLVSRNLELENITDNMDIGFAKVALEPQIKLQYLNKKAVNYLGYSREEFKEKDMFSLLGIIETVKILRKIWLLKFNNEAVKFETKAKHRNGNDVYFSVRINKILDAFGNNIAVVVFQDITEEKKTRENLILSERRFQIAIDNSEAIIFDYLPKEQRLINSEVAIKMYGIDKVMENFPQSWLEKKIVAPESEACFMNAFQEIASGESKINFIIKTFDKKGAVKWQEVTIVNVFTDGSSEIRQAVGIMHDITEVKEQELQLQHLAQIDQLTSIYNKISTKRLIENEFTYSNYNIRHALFLIDLDNFKEVNDKFGHACGDKVLVELSGEIKRAFREVDIVGRVGGDEFMVLLKNFSDKKIISDKMAELATLLDQKVTFEGRTTRVTASIGVAIYPDDGTSFDELYKKADWAMYAVKGSGKQGCEFYQDSLEPKIVLR